MSEWPWTWVRLMGHVQHVKNIMQKVALDAHPKEALPPKWMWFMYDRVDEWFESRKSND